MNPIETQQLSWCGRHWSVRDLDLTVPAGSVLALLGANGAGKSTTLKLLVNRLPPTEGSARVLGIDSRKLREREKAQIGYVAEDQHMPTWMTVEQLIAYCRPFYPTWDRALETALTDQFVLPLGRKIGELSRGMRMKTALLTSLAYRPRLLLLDEPFSGLDALVREELIRGIIDVAATGECTVVVSSHDIDEVERLADRVALLENGRLRLHDTTEALLARFRRVEVLLDHEPDAAAEVELPPSWLEVERAGRAVRFVESEHEPASTGLLCQTHFPGSQVKSQPLSLREIFKVLERGRREAIKRRANSGVTVGAATA